MRVGINMGINTSVFKIEQFKDDVKQNASYLCDGANAIIESSNVVEQSIHEILESLNKLIFQIKRDISDAKFIFSKNNEHFEEVRKDVNYNVEQFNKSQDKGYRAKCKDEIDTGKERLNEIKQKNQKLNEIIHELVNRCNEVTEMHNQISSLSGKAGECARRASKSYEGFKQKAESSMYVAEKGITIVKELDSHLSRASESYPHNEKVITINSPQTLFDAANALRNGKEKMENMGTDLNTYSSDYLSVIQDDISKEATNMCLKSAKEVEYLVEDFNQIAYEFDEAGKCLSNYERL